MTSDGPDTTHLDGRLSEFNDPNHEEASTTALDRPDVSPRDSRIGFDQRLDLSPLMTPLYSALPIRLSAQEIEIRILQIVPSLSADVPISCNLFTASLSSQPSFRALSYTWGGIEKTCSIYVKGHRIAVTANLHHALRYLRHEQIYVCIWADAICIDQSNLKERTFQVKHMPEIYGKATDVLAWLGEGTEKDDNAMDLIRLGPGELKNRDASYVQECLDSLCSRPYWTRVWVVQEIASATRRGRSCTFQCGKKSITLDQLMDFLRVIYRQRNVFDLIHIRVPKDLLSLSTEDPHRTFLQVLWHSSSLQATEPLDRIYGIRGISPRYYREHIDVDYNMDFERLCRKIVVLIIKSEGNLDILCEFRGYLSDPLSPSWARDLRKRYPGISPAFYSSSKDRKAKVKVMNDILRVKGVCIGRISELQAFNHTTRVDHWAWKPRTDLKLVSELEAVQTMAVNVLGKRYPAESNHIRGARFREMVAGGTQSSVEDSSALTRVWDKRIAFEQGKIGSDEWQRLDESFCRIFARLIGRAVFTTAEGSLGLGPQDMQVDDLVCVVYGSRLPLILRKQARSFKYVGPAYVDGAMNGEYVNDAAKEQRFWII